MSDVPNAATNMSSCHVLLPGCSRPLARAGGGLTPLHMMSGKVPQDHTQSADDGKGDAPALQPADPGHFTETELRLEPFPETFRYVHPLCTDKVEFFSADRSGPDFPHSTRIPAKKATSKHHHIHQELSKEKRHLSTKPTPAQPSAPPLLGDGGGEGRRGHGAQGHGEAQPAEVPAPLLRGRPPSRRNPPLPKTPKRGSDLEDSSTRTWCGGVGGGETGFSSKMRLGEGVGQSLKLFRE